VRGRFDEDTQGFNLDVGAPAAALPPSVAPTRRSTATRSVSGDTATGKRKKYNKLPSRLRAENEAAQREVYRLNPKGAVVRKLRPAPEAEAPPFALPTRQRDLPDTREGFDALAKAINRNGGINGSFIQVYSGSSVANIRKNFIKRLNLAGKY
jgi:hypothetical protein